MSKKQLIIGVFFSALLAILFRVTGQDLGYILLKPITTILIILLAFLFGKNAPKRYRRYILIALIFCLLGDVLLLKEAYFVYGLGAFLIGHLFFLVAYITQGGFKNRILPLVLLAAIGGGFYSFIAPKLGAMEIPVAVYVIVIILMAWQGVSLYLQERQAIFLKVAIATLLFMFSDSLIAIDKFYHPLPFAGIWILSTYWLAIGMIAYSSTKLNKE